MTDPNPAVRWQPPQRRRVYLMRHGAVDYFDAQGRPVPPDSVHLSEIGVHQAKAAGCLFGDAGIQFDKVVTSGLNRTVQTASLVLEAAAHPPAQLLVEPALQEIRPGRLSDIPPHELASAFTTAFSGAADLSARFLGGETLGSLLSRCLPAFDTLLQSDDWRTLLIVAHGGVNRALLGYMLTGNAVFLGAIEQNPACINVIDAPLAGGDGGYVLRAVNLSPLHWLHHSQSLTTMEQLLQEYIALTAH
jgi:probable phosphoglycerate mutase